MDKYKVLVVEDEPDLRELIKEKLDEAGFDVFTAENGEKGFNKAQETGPDVIISDVVMPGKDGNQLWKDLQQSDFGRDIPFIVLTARGRMRDYFEVVGVDDFIEKPFKPEELIEKVHAAIEKRGSKKSSLAPEVKPPQKQRQTEKQVDIKVSEEAEAILKAQSIDIDSAKKCKKDEHDELVAKEQVQRPRISLGTGKKKIIIFGNDMDEFCELQRRFSKYDFASELVCTLEECIDEIKRIKPDMIIIKDLAGMINGEESANRLRENPSVPDLPIVVCGGIGEKEEIKKASGEKIVTFTLNKHGNQLISKVVELLSS